MSWFVHTCTNHALCIKYSTSTSLVRGMMMSWYSLPIKAGFTCTSIFRIYLCGGTLSHNHTYIIMHTYACIWWVWLACDDTTCMCIMIHTSMMHTYFDEVLMHVLVILTTTCCQSEQLMVHMIIIVMCKHLLMPWCMYHYEALHMPWCMYHYEAMHMPWCMYHYEALLHKTCNAFACEFSEVCIKVCANVCIKVMQMYTCLG